MPLIKTRDEVVRSTAFLPPWTKKLIRNLTLHGETEGCCSLQDEVLEEV